MYFKYCLLLVVSVLLFSCGKPQKSDGKSGLNNVDISKIKDAEKDAELVFLSTDYKTITHIHFLLAQKSYSIEGGDFYLTSVGDKVYLASGDDRGELYTFSNSGVSLLTEQLDIYKKTQKILEVDGEIYRVNRDSCTFSPMSGQKEINLSTYSDTAEYCRPGKIYGSENGAEENKLFELISFESEKLAITFDKIIKLSGENLEPAHFSNLSFGNPYAYGVTQYFDYLFVAQSGPYLANWNSGIDIFNSIGELSLSYDMESLGLKGQRILALEMTPLRELILLTSEGFSTSHIYRILPFDLAVGTAKLEKLYSHAGYIGAITYSSSSDMLYISSPDGIILYSMDKREVTGEIHSLKYGESTIELKNVSKALLL
ncbi:MAG: hypothetical protein HOE90_16495 [Bacteriovoracaceae bacterium]|jgi:hypothetical protein|nr:hypothetical protein [Bacteriovoracaceae bacterium]